MPSSHLVPTPIVDKNGVVSLRYKKVQGDDAAVSRKAPKAMKQGVPSAEMDRLEEGLEDVFSSEGYGGMFTLPDLLHRRLKRYEPVVLRAFDHTANTQSSSEDRLHYLGLLASCLNNDLSSDAAGYMLFSVKTIDFVFEWSDQYTADLSYVDAYRMYVGMQSMLDEPYWNDMGWDMPKNILEADKLDAARYKAVLRVTTAVHDSLGQGLKWVNGGAYSYYSGYLLEDKNVYKHLIHNPDLVDDICELIQQRSGLPKGLVDQMISSPAQAISEGLL